MNEYIARIEVVLHVQAEDAEWAAKYAATRVYDDLNICFNDDDTIFVVDTIADTEKCTLAEVEEEE